MSDTCPKCGAESKRHTELDCLRTLVEAAHKEIDNLNGQTRELRKQVKTLSSAVRAWHEVRRVAKGGSSERSLSHVMSDAQMKLNAALDVCMCGEPMEGHSLYSGHTPVSMREYYSE